MKRTLSLFVLLALLISTLSGCGFTVPRPEIKEGRFEFFVTYEVDGEINTVSGVYVCEYNGTDWALDGGSHRDWAGHIEGGLEDEIEIGATDDGGTIVLAFHLYPDYFMGEDVSGGNGEPVPRLNVRYPYDEFGGMDFIQEAEIIEETYGARILYYEYGEPIENSFSLFNF